MACIHSVIFTLQLLYSHLSRLPRQSQTVEQTTIRTLLDSHMHIGLCSSHWPTYVHIVPLVVTQRLIHTSYFLKPLHKPLTLILPHSHSFLIKHTCSNPVVGNSTSEKLSFFWNLFAYSVLLSPSERCSSNLWMKKARCSYLCWQWEIYPSRVEGRIDVQD